MAAADLDPTVDVLEREAAKLLQEVRSGVGGMHGRGGAGPLGWAGLGRAQPEPGLRGHAGMACMQQQHSCAAACSSGSHCRVAAGLQLYTHTRPPRRCCLQISALSARVEPGGGVLPEACLKYRPPATAVKKTR